MARKHAEEEHENHERWLVSYADFITLLFAFFVVMYALSSLNEGKYRILSTSLVNAFRSGSTITLNATPPKGSANTMVEVPQTKPIARAVQSQTVQQEQARLNNLSSDMRRMLEPLVQGGQVSIRQTDRGIVVDIRESALFQTGQSVLSKGSVKMLTQLSTLLNTVDNSVSVEGFTDDIPIKTALYPSNWELSAARASSVVRLFQEEGVKSERLVAIGRAANMPVAENTSADGRAKNRRVSITILANTASPVGGQPLSVEQMQTLGHLQEGTDASVSTAAPPLPEETISSGG